MVLGPRERAQQIQDNIRGKPRGGGDGTSAPTQPKPAKKPSFAETLKLNMSQAREKLGSLALTNNYYVTIPLTVQLRDYITQVVERDGKLVKFIDNQLGFFCSEATLPVSSFATAEVKDNYLGITQEFAHTRLYTDLDFTFYVDSDYNTLVYFETWMDFISGTKPRLTRNAVSERDELMPNYHRRMNFPESYKSNQIRILKFERDYNRSLEYRFINAFPKGLTAIPVSYGPADLLKVTVTLNFDRYTVERGTFSKLATSAGEQIQSQIDESIRRTERQ